MKNKNKKKTRAVKIHTNGKKRNDNVEANKVTAKGDSGRGFYGNTDGIDSVT